jgi:hypothetical protein
MIIVIAGSERCALLALLGPQAMSACAPLLEVKRTGGSDFLAGDAPAGPVAHPQNR